MSHYSTSRATKPYSYQLLGVGSVTRVLHLQPSSDHDAPLRCELSEWDATGCPYEAVSYAWGNLTLDRTLLCGNGDRFIPITQSLDVLLRALRRPSTRRTLWVDAVCIDQSDLLERAEQVREMPSIYRQASSVVLWIGHDHDDGERALQFLDKHKDSLMLMADFATKYGQSYHESQHVEAGNIMARMAEEIQRFSRSGLQPFRSLLQRRWFRRRWVIQEAVLASEALIQCGSASLKLETFITGVMALDVYDKHLAERNWSWSSPGVMSQDASELQPMMHGNVKDILQGIWDFSSFSSTRGIGSATEVSHSLLELLSGFHAAKCSDSRDRVYSLVGLSDDAQPAVRGNEAPRPQTIFYSEIYPSYSDSLSKDKMKIQVQISYEVDASASYTSLARQMANSSANGLSRVLAFAGAFRQPAGTFGSAIPRSWIPDWRANRRFLPRNGSGSIVEPGTDEKSLWWELATTNELTLSGWKHSTISEVLRYGLDVRDHSTRHIRETARKWAKFYGGDNLREVFRVRQPAVQTSEPKEQWQRFFALINMHRRQWLSVLKHPPIDFVRLIFKRLPKSERATESSTTIEDRSNTGETSQKDGRSPLSQNSRSYNNADIAVANARAASSVHGNEPRREAPLWLQSCLQTLAELMTGRLLCKNDKGEILNCPSSVKVRDIIMIPYCCDSPLIVRQTSIRKFKKSREFPSQSVGSMGQESKPEDYLFVGDCLIEGMEDPRARWMEDHIEKLKSEKPMKFTLI